MAELADAPDLGSGERSCGFESHYLDSSAPLRGNKHKKVQTIERNQTEEHEIVAQQKHCPTYSAWSNGRSWKCHWLPSDEEQGLYRRLVR